MSALNKKLFREIFQLKGQLIAIVIVVACGIANFVTFRSVHSSLALTQQTYYDEFKFADVFVSAQRVPESVAQRIREIPGVAAIETRVVTSVLLDLPDVEEAASGNMISIPDNGQPLLNQLYLRNGRWVTPGADNEVIVSAAFADANGFVEGSQFSAVINGTKRKLTVVGRALTPEYTIEITPGSFNIDNKRYGVMWMARSALAAAFDMKGAFNNASLKLEAGINERTVRENIDVILDPYGSIGAINREDQLSHRVSKRRDHSDACSRSAHPDDLSWCGNLLIEHRSDASREHATYVDRHPQSIWLLQSCRWHTLHRLCTWLQQVSGR